MKIPIYNPNNELVGEIEDNIYWSQRDYNQNQIFRKFGNSIAIGKKVLKQLIQNKVKIIAILVVNFSINSFYAATTLNHFLKNSQEIDYSQKGNFYGKQRTMPMDKWIRLLNQEEVKNLKIERQSEL